MDVVFRASDIGFSDVYDIGAFRAIDNGVITSANVMLDGIDAVPALERLRERPYISIEWQRNLWEHPVLPPGQVPSMVNGDGMFAWGHDKKSPLYGRATYDDSYREFRAEVELCLQHAGRLPVCTGTFSFEGELEQAFLDVCEEFGIAVNPYSYDLFPSNAKYAGMNYSMVVLGPDMLHQESPHWYDLSYFAEYDPIAWIREVPLEDDGRYLITMHPGFVDDHVEQTSSMTMHRIREYEFAVSKEVRAWVDECGMDVMNQKEMLEHLVTAPAYTECSIAEGE